MSYCKGQYETSHLALINWKRRCYKQRDFLIQHSGRRGSEIATVLKSALLLKSGILVNDNSDKRTRNTKPPVSTSQRRRTEAAALMRPSSIVDDKHVGLRVCQRTRFPSAAQISAGQRRQPRFPVAFVAVPAGASRRSGRLALVQPTAFSPRCAAHQASLLDYWLRTFSNHVIISMTKASIP